MKANGEKIKNALECDMHENPQVVQFCEEMRKADILPELELARQQEENFKKRLNPEKTIPPKLNYVLPKKPRGPQNQDVEKFEIKQTLKKKKNQHFVMLFETESGRKKNVITDLNATILTGAQEIDMRKDAYVNCTPTRGIHIQKRANKKSSPKYKTILEEQQK